MQSRMALLLLLVVIAQAASRAEMSATDLELSSVPLPTNVTVKAYNFITEVSWDYPSMLQTPVFIVQIKFYGKATWIDACNTSDHNCSIPYESSDPSSSSWVRVKARLGQKESAYVESKEFILCKEGEIGPPKLDIRQKKDHIIIDIYHPLATINGKAEVIYDDNTCYIFTYNVYVRINESENTSKMYMRKEDDCNETQCHLSIPVSSLNSRYCIKAEGFSEIWIVTTEQSKELCITILDHKSGGNSFWIPIVAAFLVFVVVILLVMLSH